MYYGGIEPELTEGGDQQLRTEGANMFHIREGKVARLVLYWHRDRALSDLGLAPEGDPASE